MHSRKFYILLITFALIFAMQAKTVFSNSAIESLKLQAIPKEILDTECPLFLTFQMQVIVGTKIYKSELLPVKYRLIGDNGYASNLLHRFALKI